jgi:hypothetical protein
LNKNGQINRKNSTNTRFSASLISKYFLVFALSKNTLEIHIPHNREQENYIADENGNTDDQLGYKVMAPNRKSTDKETIANQTSFREAAFSFECLRFSSMLYLGQGVSECVILGFKRGKPRL